jgi:succinate dehydrogenase / fumarate reductase flavoprotein subunit
MYHQFKQLADIDITSAPMEVGPTTHYIMGGIRVEADTQASTVPGLFACGECGGGINGANRLGGNSLSDLLVLGKRAGEHAAQFAKKHGSGRIDPARVAVAQREALAPFERGGSEAEGPYKVQFDLQETMQKLVGIVRTGDEMQNALEAIATLHQRTATVGVVGHREYNPGWHTALDLTNLLTVAEAIARSALAREESRGAQFREDFPDKDPVWGKVNNVVRKAADGSMEVEKIPIPAMPQDLQKIIEEMG